MKLIRDRTPGLLPGSTRIATYDEKYMLLRGKLCEEAAEAASSTSKEELFKELGDLYEVMKAVALMAGGSFADVIIAARKKAAEKGDFEMGTILLFDPEWNK